MKNDGIGEVPAGSEQSQVTDAIETLRPGEAPLGSLTPEEQHWLATAFAHLNRVYGAREAGKPGNEAFCIFEVGNAYVQFRAPWDSQQLVCEAVSARSVPEIAAVLTTKADEALRQLGFKAPEIPPNYSQTITIGCPEDLGYAVRLAFRVMKQVYQVMDFRPSTFKENIPSGRESIRERITREISNNPRFKEAKPYRYETVVEVGAEGGTIAIVGMRHGGGWTFRRTVNDSTPELIDEEPIFKKSAEANTWERALRLLDKYRWQGLYPLQVHPEFRDRVWIAVQDRVARDNKKPVNLEKWRDLCT
jgi:hypothetical protein